MSSVHRQPEISHAYGRRVALVLVDLQNDFCHPDGVFHRADLRLAERERLVECINTLAAAARAGGHLVMWTKMTWSDDREVGLLAKRSPFLAHEGLRRGTWGAELLSELDVDETDEIIEKPRFSAFFSTDIDARLQAATIETLVVAGVRTDFCVESTVRDALFRDLEVFVPADAVGGYVADLHEHSLRLMGTVFASVVSTRDAVGLLQQSPVQATPQEV